MVARLLGWMGAILVAVAGIATAGAEEKVYPAIKCEGLGSTFICAAINIDGVQGTPYWEFNTIPKDGAYGVSYVGPREVPAHWTMLTFTVEDGKNSVRLKTIVRRKDGKIQFAASDSAEQHVERE